MEIKLTQKERIFLEEAKVQEKVCIQKYENYAHQANDPELKHLFNKLGEQEQHHHDSLSLLLQGKKPNLGQGEGQGQESNSNQKQQTQSLIKNNFDGTMINESDKVLCIDLFSTEKYVSSTYNSDIFDCTNSDVREVLQHIQKEEQTHGEELLNYMTSNGIIKIN